MPRKRKLEDCASAVVQLCGQNLKLVRQKEAEFQHQTNKSFIINKLLDELIRLREK